MREWGGEGEGRGEEKKNKSQKKISRMLGKLGKSPHNALGHRDLFASPTFWRVGEVLAMWGKCGGSVGEVWRGGVGWGAPDRLGAVYSVGAGVFPTGFPQGIKKPP
jgi:hypothetical protein